MSDEHDDADFGARDAAQVFAESFARKGLGRVATSTPPMRIAPPQVAPAFTSPVKALTPQSVVAHTLAGPMTYVAAPSKAEPSLSSVVAQPTSVTAPFAPAPPAYTPVQDVGRPARAYVSPASVNVVPASSSGSGGGSGGSPAPQPEAYEDVWSPPAVSLPSRSSLAPVTSTALATVASAPPKLSLWRRILNFLGFGRPSVSPAIHGEPRDLKTEAASLVRRARAGDQNAMGILELVGKNAREGQPKAKAAYAVMLAYCKAHPVDATMSSEPNDPTFCEAVKLATGPTLYDNRIRSFAHGEFGTEEKRAFSHGVRYPDRPYPGRLPDDLARAHRMGRTVGLARKLQMVRMPESPLSRYDARVGHELDPDIGAELDLISKRG